MHDAAMLAELIRANQPCVALPGAGVSTETQGDPGGCRHRLWSNCDSATYSRSAMTDLDLSLRRVDGEALTGQFWRFTPRGVERQEALGLL
jgi:NAD-dependent SIR2 family protein deacetylase